VSVVANVAINVDSRNAVSKLRQVEQASSKLDQTYQDLNGRLRDANGRFIKAGEAAQAASGKVNILGNAVKNLAAQLVVADLARRFFKGFDEAEKAAAAVRTLGVDSKALEAQLLGVSNRLGGLYSQTQLLAASYDVASAGFANAADNAKILEASAKGATGGLSDINTVADAVTSVLNTYGKSAAEAGALVDGFIQTQNDGKITLNQYAEQIGKLAPTAAAAGVGIQELNAAVATITPQGVRVEAAVAGLNQALVAILKPSKEASDLAEALGIDFNEAGLRAKGFGGLLQEVKEKTGGSTTALVQLFGSVDALKAVLPLVNDDLVKYNQNVQKQADVSGVADKATEELGGTVSAEVSKMINQIGNLTRSLDTVLGPALGGIVKLINVVIAEATRGINVLGQLFSLGKNTTILKGALESGNLRGSAAARVIPGVDELIGQQRRQQLQRQAGAGTGFLGAGFNAQKFAELLKQQPEIKRLLGAGAAPAAGGGTAAGVDPSIQAVLDGLGQSGGKGRTGKTDAEKAAEKAAREAEKLAQEIQRSLELGDRLGTEFSRQVLLLGEANEIEQKRLQIQFDYEDRAKQIAELKNTEQQTNLSQLNDEIRRLEIIELQTEALKKQAEEAEKLFKKSLEGAEFGVAGEGTVASGLTDAIAKLKEDLNPIKLATDSIVNGATAIGDAFSTAFGEVITGAKSTQEALADAFKSIGQAFISMALEIIAKQMTLIILQTILNALSGGGGGAMGTANKNLSGTGALSPGKMFPTGAFAEGGFVTGPTNALIGEGGESEYVIPASKMRTAMSRYAGGARGNNVIPGSGAEGGTEQGGVATMEPIDVRYSVERINSVDYVTADQFQAGMARAAQQGAVQGERRAMRSLKNSSATRRSVGI
jgi:TP901 family phage tail tape measure protein